MTGWLFAVLSLASFCGALMAVVMGVGGGVFLLAIMAMFFLPAILIPLQGIVTLGTGASLIVLMWRHMLWATLLPFGCGAIVGAALGRADLRGVAHRPAAGAYRRFHSDPGLVAEDLDPRIPT